jgi:CDP-paratose 2-epimerase
MKVLVTGSSGLIGSEAVEYYDREGHQVVGVDNNMRAEFFCSQGDTSWNLNRLKDITKNFESTVLTSAIAWVFLNYLKLIPLI